MLLSLSGFLFEDDYRSQSVSFADFCSLAASAGYRGVELRGTQVNPDTATEERRKRLDAVRGAGLMVTCLTARGLPPGGAERDEFFLRYLDLCRDMRCPLLKTSSEPTWLRGAASRAAEYGVTLATNNHVGTALETVDGTRRYFDQIAHPNVGLLYDSFHLRLRGEDYLGCIDEFAGITRNILVHSIRPAGAGEEAEMERNGRRWVKGLPDDAGVQDWPAILGSFKRLGYDGPITVIESAWPADRREYVARHCAEVLHRVWEEA